MSSNADLPAPTPGASAVLVLRNGKRLSIANVGDTRVVLVRGRAALRLSEEHKPYEEREMALVIERGGHVVGDGQAGYVNRRLAISRSLGDFRA